MILAAASLLLQVGPSQASEIEFTEVSRQAGIAFLHSMGSETVENILEGSGSGACAADYDGDGDVDLYFVDGGDAQAGREGGGANRLYRNESGDRFIDVARRAGVLGTGYGQGCVFGDYDNDGDLDLYVTQYGADALYRNRGNGNFGEVAKTAGIAGNGWSTGASFGDCDGDGDLDLYVSRYLDFRLGREPKRSRLSAKEGYTTFPGPRDYDGVPDVLYRNNGNGIFTESSRVSGVAIHAGKGLQAVFFDFDRDGDQDIYVANDRTPNALYTNRGDCVFQDTALMAGVAHDERGDDTGAMGLAVGDLDSDGLWDLLVTNMVFEYNSLYRNQGEGLFEDVTRQARVASRTYGYVGWGAAFVDFDNDADLDIVVVNGHVHDHVDIFSDSVSFEQSNLLFSNQGDGRFRDVTERVGQALRGPKVSRGLAVLDYDDDGDEDMAVTNLNARASLLRNDGGNLNPWIRIVVEPGRGPTALGTRIDVRTENTFQTKAVRGSSSYLSQHDVRLLFGLGEDQRVQDLEVRWPSGLRQHWVDLPVRRSFGLWRPASITLDRG